MIPTRGLLLIALCPVLMRASGSADWIQSAGGTITRAPDGQITGVDLASSWVGDSDLTQLSTFPGLAILNLSLTRISDHGLEQLRTVPNIADLDLRYAEVITDEGL